MVVLQRAARPRRRLSQFVNHPITDVVVMILIIISVILVVVEEIANQVPRWVPLASDIVTGLFAVELSLRYVIAKKKGRFFRRYWPDLLALLPLLRPLRFFRFFRLFRLFRLFQLGILLDRRVSLLRGILRVNFYFLWALLVFTGVLVVGSALIGFLVERGSSAAEFSDIKESLWWALYSIIAGEPIGAVPETALGRGLLAIMMLGGMTLFAVFTGIVSATMIDRLQGTARVSEMDIDELEDHIVILGWHSGAAPLLAEMAVDRELRDLPVVLVNTLEEAPDLSSTGFRADMVYHLEGDYTQVQTLEQSGIRRASRAVVLADDVMTHDYATRDARNVLAALTIERLNPRIYCVVELVEAAHKDTLKMADVEVVIMRSDLAGRALASACRGVHVMDVMMNLLTMRRGEMIHRLPGPTTPMPFGRLLSELKAERDALVIAVERDGGEAQVNPKPDFMVGPDDCLLVIGGSPAPK